MIVRNDKTIGSIRYGSLIISTIYNGIRKVHGGGSSVFGAGYWINNEIWDNNDGWRNG